MTPSTAFLFSNKFKGQFRNGAVTIGNFDGVHRGHVRLIERLKALADEIDGPAVVFTFDPHPARLLHPEAAPLPLIWTEHKAQILGKLAVDAVLVFPTSRSFLELTPRGFFDHVIRDTLGARAMVEGPNFFFGHNRSGNVETLREYCAAAAMRFEVVPPVEIDGQIVSSSRIRQMLLEGRVEEAAAMLGRPHRLRGTVVRGAGRGRQLGFPTANLGHCQTLAPAAGIYAGLTRIGTEAHPAAISVGGNPTFGENALKIEAFLLDFCGDLYDRPLEVDFLARLRAMRKFPSPEALIEQMGLDVEAVRRVVQETGGSWAVDSR
jgi:riboflavin kinase / FMN adenylyltransferase